jgi:hypothetical protein
MSAQDTAPRAPIAYKLYSLWDDNGPEPRKYEGAGSKRFVDALQAALADHYALGTFAPQGWEREAVYPA